MGDLIKRVMSIALLVAPILAVSQDVVSGEKDTQKSKIYKILDINKSWENDRQRGIWKEMLEKGEAAKPFGHGDPCLLEKSLPVCNSDVDA